MFPAFRFLILEVEEHSHYTFALAAYAVILCFVIRTEVYIFAEKSVLAESVGQVRIENVLAYFNEVGAVVCLAVLYCVEGIEQRAAYKAYLGSRTRVARRNGHCGARKELEGIFVNVTFLKVIRHYLLGLVVGICRSHQLRVHCVERIFPHVGNESGIVGILSMTYLPRYRLAIALVELGKRAHGVDKR